MKVLLLAPHPFFQSRGTPIAVDLLLRVLSSLGHEVDVVAFPEGEDRKYVNVTIHRADLPIKVSGVRPGFSLKKLYCDWGLYRTARKLLKAKRYDVIHAAEEAAFLAAWFRRRFKVPFVYDMDSLMSAQMADKSSLFSLVKPLLARLEASPMRTALAVAPMCQDLADVAARVRDRDSIFLIKDVSLIEEQPLVPAQVTNIRQNLGNQLPVILYVGNLEPYQGVDLLLDAMACMQDLNVDANLVFIGGVKEHIDHYRGLCDRLSIADKVIFLGQRPVADLGAYLSQADVLVSPRTKGNNTPMKIYSYLHSGVPVVATRLATHTQVLNDDIAVLSEPDPASFANAIVKLLGDPELRSSLGARARAYAEREHGFAHFVASVGALYNFLEHELCKRA